jgi:hypothetical protein
MLRALVVDFSHISFTRHMFAAVQAATNVENSGWLLNSLLALQVWMVSNYMITSLAAIRRQADTNENAVSLAKFMALLSRNAQIVTRLDFKAVYPSREALRRWFCNDCLI